MDKQTGSVTLSKRTLIIIIMVVLLLIVGGITMGLNWNNWFGEKPPASQTDFNPDIDGDAGEWTGEKPKDKGGEATGIKIPGYPSITLPADKKDVTVALLNPEGNPCYFTFKLVLKDSGETLYTSKMVPPGKAISKISLNRALPIGEYNATIQITTSSLEDGTAMNGANVETVLIVK